MATLPKATQAIQNKLGTGQQKDYETATANGYNKSNYQSGWGIGDSSNLTGGFNGFNDSNALRNEISRVNTVMGNRTGYGLGNDQYNSYYDKLNSAYSPFTQAETKATNAQTNFDTQNKAHLAQMDSLKSAFDTKLNANTDAYNQAFGNFNSQITGANESYKQGAGYQGYVQSMDQTVDSIASKYGFSFNRDVATQQAEAEAQALRDANADAGRKNESANKLNTGKIDANLMNMAEGLDRNYFQQMMGQQQNQVNGGLNAGIAADQDLRLQMNRQAEMGGAYRDANLGTMEEQQRFSNEQLRLTEAMGTINQQALAKANSSMQDWDMKMYDVISNDRNFYKGAADMEWGQSQDMVNQYLAQQAALTSNHQWQTGFDYGAMRDNVGDSQVQQNFDYGAMRDLVGDSQFDRTLAQNQFEAGQNQQNWNQQFDYTAGRDKIGDSQWGQEFNWNKLMDEAGLTGNYNGDRTLQGQTFDWGKLVDEAGLTGLYNGKNTWDRTMDEFDMNMAQQQLALQRASASRSGGGGGGSSSGGSSSTSSLGNAYAQFQDAKSNAPQTKEDAEYMQKLAKLSPALLETYNKVSTQPVMQNKTLNDKYIQSLTGGYLAPKTTTNWDKLNDLWNFKNL